MIVGWILNFSLYLLVQITSALPNAVWPSGVNDFFAAIYGPLSLLNTILPLDQLFVVTSAVFVIELAFMAFKFVKLIANLFRGSGA